MLLWIVYFISFSFAQTILYRNGPCPLAGKFCSNGLIEMAQDASKNFYVSDFSKTLKKIDSTTGQVMWSTSFTYLIKSIAFLGNDIVAGGTKEFHVMNSQTGAIKKTIPIPILFVISNIFVFESTVYVSNINSGSIHAYYPNGTLARFETQLPSIFALRVYNDKIYAGGPRGRFVILNRGNGALEKSLTTNQADIFDLLFPDSRFYYSASSDKSVRKWNITDLSIVDELRGHTDSVLSLAIDVAGLYSTSIDKTMIHWSPIDGNILQRFTGHTHSIQKVLVSDGVLYTASEDGTLRKWERTDTHRVSAYQLPTFSFQYVVRYGDALYIGTSLHGILKWNLKDKTPSTFRDKLSGQVTSMEFSTDFLLAGTSTGKIYVWRWTVESPYKTLNAHSSSVTTLTLGSTSDELISTSLDGNVSIWNLFSGIKIKTFVQASPIYSLFMNGNEIYLGMDGCVQIIHKDTGIPLGVIDRFSGPVLSLYVLDTKLYVGDSAGGISSWDTHTRLRLANAPLLHKKGVTELVLNSDQRLFSASLDSYIIEWDPITFEPLNILYGHKFGISGFNITDSAIYSISSGGELMSWNI